MENRDADNFAYAMALGPRIGPLGEVVGVRGLAVHGSHADFNRLLEPTPRLAIQVTPSSVRLQADDLCVALLPRHRPPIDGRGTALGVTRRLSRLTSLRAVFIGAQERRVKA